MNTQVAPAAAHRPRRLAVLALAAWAVLFAGLALAGFFQTLVQGIVHPDEGWFLQVVRRVAEGEVLYRDVYYSPTPLAVYLAAAFTAAFGREVVVLRILDSLIFAATAVVVCGTVRRLGGGRGLVLLTALAMLYFAPAGRTGPGSIYTVLASLFLSVTLALYLEWHRMGVSGTPARRLWLLLLAAGAAASLAFAAKQNIGLLALAALLAAVVLAGPAGSLAERFLARPAAALVGFALVAALVLLPTVLAGAWPRFVEYGFLSQGQYVKQAPLPYWVAARQSPPVYLLGPATFLALAVLFVRGPDRRTTAAAAFFCVAGFLSFFPRADIVHVPAAAPTLLVGLGLAAVRVRATLGPRQQTAWTRLGAACAAVLAAVLIWIYGVLYAGLAAAGHPGTALPPCRHLWLAPPYRDDLEATTGLLDKHLPTDEPVYLLGPNASLYYLTTGRRNPTPYDWGLSTCFGLDGENAVKAALARGEFRWVAVEAFPWDSAAYRQLRPDLIDHVVATLRHRVRCGAWVLFQADPPVALRGPGEPAPPRP